MYTNPFNPDKHVMLYVPFDNSNTVRNLSTLPIVPGRRKQTEKHSTSSLMTWMNTFLHNVPVTRRKIIHLYQATHGVNSPPYHYLQSTITSNQQQVYSLDYPRTLTANTVNVATGYSLSYIKASNITYRKAYQGISYHLDSIMG